MDFDLNGFFEVENIINAIFNGVPVVDDTGTEAPGAQGFSTTTADRAPTIPAAPPSSLGKGYGGQSSSWSSASIRPSGGEDEQTQLPTMSPTSSDRGVESMLDLNTGLGMHLLSAPDMDLPSAIALLPKPKNHVKRSYSIAFADEDDQSVNAPRFISVAEACQFPEKKLRDELVKLYFEHFHQFCPVVDEFDFMEIYNTIQDDEELPKKLDLTLFQAMMNVAFGHLPSARLLNTPYKSIYEGQKAFFERASLLYRVRFTSDHFALTQTALLLTFWSPFDSEFQVNNYWVARAFYHARATKLWDWKRESEPASSRRRITWWCCLLRDRLISIALRRPYRMQENKGTWPSIKKEDFGLEIIFPKFATVTTKVTAIESFIWLCHLSNIMRDVANFHEKRRFDREWADKIVDETDVVPELAQVSRFSNQLKNWKEEYLKVSGDYIKSIRPGSSKMPSYVLIICNATLAMLYLPYIHCPTGSIELVRRFQRVALRGIKSASSAVALHVHKLNAVSTVQEEFIVGIIAWIALPMAVFKVLEDPSVSRDPKNGCYKDFVPFLSALATRFPAAKLLMDIMGEQTSQIVERSKALGVIRNSIPIRTTNRQGSTSSDKGDRSGKVGESFPSNDAEEAELLSCVSKMVDLRLSTDGST